MVVTTSPTPVASTNTMILPAGGKPVIALMCCTVQVSLSNCTNYTVCIAGLFL